MSVNPDFKELFKILNEEQVRYLVVGAYAVTYHTEPRYTKDLDILIEPSVENAERVWTALVKFGAPMADATIQNFTDENMVYQIGVEPNRIDIMMSIAGLDFEQAWVSRATSQYGDQEIYILGLDALIVAKKASGRPQDMIDADSLEKSKSHKDP
jgi:hypothetical protein